MVMVILWLWLVLLWLGFSQQTLRGALLGWVVWGGEDFGDAAEPVLVHVVGCSVHVGCVVDINEVSFAVKAENLYPPRERLVS